jgi:hypothetical protein
MKGYENQERVVSGVEDWSPPQRERRRCGCGTIIRQSNPETHCEVCLRKMRAEDPKRKPRW